MERPIKLSQHSEDGAPRRLLSDISLLVAKSKRIVVVTGAGISCSSGIPDFRSSDGLYALVKEKHPDVVLKGRDLFDASLFRNPESTAVFYTFISQLKQAIDAVTPSPTHHFLKALDTKGKLLRSYTQNIDGLESQAGLLCSSKPEARATGKGKSKLRRREVRNIQLHGDIHKVRCLACSSEFACTQDHLDIFDQGDAPECPDCCERFEARKARSARPIRVGTLRPAIVLYDEPHPLGDEIGEIQGADINRKPDLLIIMGTSLKVHGLKKLVKDFAKSVHASASSNKSKMRKVIFVNRTPPGSEWSGVIDHYIEGDCDAWCSMVLEDWKKMRPVDWEVQKTLITSNGNLSLTSPMKVVKPGIPKSKGKGGSVENRKPRNAEAENLPPGRPTPMVTTPHNKKSREPAGDVSMGSPGQIGWRGSPMVVSPSSPGKRRQASSHYDSLHSSPSKKRTMGVKSTGPPVPWGMFGEALDLAVDEEDEEDMITPLRPKGREKAVA